MFLLDKQLYFYYNFILIYQLNDQNIFPYEDFRFL